MSHFETIAEPMLDAHVGRQATPTVLNRIMATILSSGTQSDRSLYVHTDEGAVLEIEGSVQTMALRQFLVPGHRVLIVVSSVDVEISAPRSRSSLSAERMGGESGLEGKSRWRGLCDGKILGQPVTLTSTHVAPWTNRLVQTWDPVSVSIAPSAVRLMPLGVCARLRMRLFTSPTRSLAVEPKNPSQSGKGIHPSQ